MGYEVPLGVGGADCVVEGLVDYRALRGALQRVEHLIPDGYQGVHDDLGREGVWLCPAHAFTLFRCRLPYWSTVVSHPGETTTVVIGSSTTAGPMSFEPRSREERS